VNSKLLIDAIVHQTTVLIAHLSTAAGIRAPLAHIADQVFVELSREIEAQGVSRKVAADMFGLAIRSYQKKVQRLTESVSVRDRTLWQAVIERLEQSGSTSRRELLELFNRDDPAVVGSVLNDLVSSGLVYRTGSGETSVFGITKDHDRTRAVSEQRRESLIPIVWAVVCRSGGTNRSALLNQLKVDESALDDALKTLEAEGRVTRVGIGESATYSASTLIVPLDAEHGWEAAVFDHFQAVVRAIGTKVRRGLARATQSDVNGGATLTFALHDEHPHKDEVLGLLRRVRTDVNELWNRVQQHNEQNRIPDGTATQVSFYFGQCVTAEDER
jgi:DNA-binding HxlR family transcriptional regulator